MTASRPNPFNINIVRISLSNRRCYSARTASSSHTRSTTRCTYSSKSLGRWTTRVLWSQIILSLKSHCRKIMGYPRERTSDPFFVVGIRIQRALHRALLLPRYRGTQPVCNVTRTYNLCLTASASSLSARPDPCLRALRQALASHCRKVVSLCLLR